MAILKTNEHTRQWDKTISEWTGYLIGFLALASFVLSYEEVSR